MVDTTTIVIEQRFVAFVDILGFADLVRRATHEPALRTQIVSALRQVREFELPNRSGPGLRVDYFSDSLIASAPHSPDGMYQLLLALDDLAWRLLQIDVLMRGAVTLGGIYQDDDLVFGEGVIEAYRLENTIAKYPRVVLSRVVVDAAHSYDSMDEVWEAYRASRLIRDVDGVTFLNYLNDVAAFNLFPRTRSSPSALQNPWFTRGSTVRDHIQQRIDTVLDAPDVYAKVKWLASYWNRVVVRDRADDTLLLGRIVLPSDAPPPRPLPFRT